MHHEAFRNLLPDASLVREDSVALVAGSVHATEAALVAQAVDRRRREFTGGRVLARQLLADLGHAQDALGADAYGVPEWPQGTIGCITHAAGRVAVAVASREHAQGIGIDMEAVERFHRGLEAQVLSEREMRQLQGVAGDERKARVAVLFCAKEAWFKCQFPLLQRRLGLHDAEVEVDWGSGRFVIRPRAALDSRGGITGCGSVHDGIARAAIVLGHDALTAMALRAWRLPGVD
jgi:4'-phosphopantetheinyl transferase EntD